MPETIYIDEYPEGDKVAVSYDGVTITFSEYVHRNEELNISGFTKGEAIDAARAILKHFNCGMDD